MIYQKEKYFSCYSPNLRSFLESNGFKVIATFEHVREKKVCWVFDRVPELSKYLEEWSSMKR